ncbi:MAG: hypothetical protein QE265_06730 [Rhodoferax sp.]|nr:hypothetical protein [Rhodoferax sp.]
MQLPSMDRTPNLRPGGAEAVSSGAHRVLPVAPVNPSVSVSSTIESTPDVIDKVNPALKPAAVCEAPHHSVSDPSAQGIEAAVPKDWTIHKPEKEKVEDPPPKPISQMLIDHLRTMWTASANAVQVAQVHEQVITPQSGSGTDAPGQWAKQALVYTPSKVKKTENL